MALGLLSKAQATTEYLRLGWDALLAVTLLIEEGVWNNHQSSLSFDS
jgi:hypothetical protein